MRLRCGLALRAMAWAVVVLWVPWGGPVRAQEAAGAAPGRATVRVDASDVVLQGNRRMLIGSNVAAWNTAECFSSPVLTRWLTELSPGLIRLPGGSWSDIVYWNGNGVRDDEGNVDATRMKDGWPDVDYSGYKRLFVTDGTRRISSGDWHGHVGVKEMHELIQGLPDCTALVTVNAGTGRPLDAAEWVRWAVGKMGYGVAYWEVGNELGGSWEAGHFLPDGSELNGRAYAERYEQFARAMKAVDPTVKVGCMDWLNDVMARCGGLVDFLSWHTYPLRGSQTREEMLRIALEEPRRIAASFHRLVDRYQPDRADKIDLGVSEWNLGLEGGLEVDMFGAIWTALFVGSMLENGIDFANQWDAFTHNAGGSLLYSQDPLARKAQYWVFWLWSHYMADGVLECTVEGPGTLHVFATRNDDAVCLMAVNASEYEESALDVSLDGFKPAAEGEVAVLSHRGMFWDRLANRLLWSGGPQVDPIEVGPAFSVTVPPMAVECIRIPSAEKPALSEQAEQRRGMEGKTFGPAELRILMPDSGYEDTPVSGWVLAFLPGTDDPYPVPLPSARLTVAGPAAPERPDVRLAEAAGPFVLRPSGPGEATVTVSLGDDSASAGVAFAASVPKPVVLWEFEAESLGRGYRSHWDLSTDDSVRANQRVARIDLKGVVPDQEHRELLVMDIPRGAQINRENIRGVFFDLSVSRDFQCDDPNAGIQIVMQSPADYWMQLGDVPLPAAGDPWQTHTVRITQENHIRAVHAAYNVWFILHSQKPMTGAIFIDRAGLMVR